MNGDFWEMALGVIVVIFMICMIPTCMRDEKECEAKGGVFKYFSDDLTWICLSKDAVIK